MGWFGENGLGIICDNGLVAETDDCPCGCPSFTGRTITYVDKNVVGGTGDGSTWANAYTSIQDAIDAKPKTEIDIQGYGESDAYPAGIILAECVYLKGVDDVWIDGGGSGTGISGSSITTTKIDSINIKDCFNGFLNCYNIIKCIIYNCSTGIKSTTHASIIDNCEVYNCSTGYSGSLFNIIDSNAHDNTSYGFSISDSVAFNCTAINNGLTGFYGNQLTLTNCISNGNTASAFQVAMGFWNNSIITGSTYINCSASGNFDCGFADSGSPVYITCSESGNCQSGRASCQPITGICDTV